MTGERHDPAAGMRPPADAVTAHLVSTVGRLHELAVAWHRRPPSTAEDDGGIAALVLHLHAVNFALWHHEDAVRRPGADDREVADRKRRIDDLNARRNGAIEDIDDALLAQLTLRPDAPLHTETPAAIVDRLSVLTLRIMHADTAGHPPSQIATLSGQYDDLVGGLERFLAGLHTGDVRFRVYRQFKSAGLRSLCPLFADRTDDAGVRGGAEMDVR